MNSIEKFEWIYQNYRLGMLAMAYSILKNKETSEDIVHKAFINIMEKIDMFDIYDKRTKAYCTIAVKNLCLNYQKREKHFKIEQLDLYEDSVLNLPGINNIDQVEAHIVYESLVNEINTLPDLQRKVFWLKTNYGFSFATIGQILNVTPVNARKIYSRAKLKIQSILKGEDYYYE